MPVLVLVVGYRGEGSGKTVITASLVALLKAEGVRVAPFKPYAATLIWENPSILGEVMKRRLVVSGDGLRLSSISGIHPEIVNPVAILVGEADASRNSWRPPPLPARSPLDFGVLGRVSMCRGERVDTLHFVNVEALASIPKTMQEAVIDAASGLRPFPLRVGREFLESVLTGGQENAVMTCLNRIASKSDIIIIESNSEVPLPISVKPDLVLVAAPGVAGVIPGDRYVKSLQALGMASGRPAVTVSVADVLRLSGVTETIPLPILESPEDLLPRGTIERIATRILGLLEENTSGGAPQE